MAYQDKPKYIDYTDYLMESCPDCGGELVVREGPWGKFIGCKEYPHCEYKRKYEEE